MERKIVAFAHLVNKDQGNYLPKTIAGIYAIQEGTSIELYFVQTQPCDHSYYCNNERDLVLVQRIGPNVDIRYLLFEEPGMFDQFLEVNKYPNFVADYFTRKPKEEIKEEMGYTVGLDLCRGWSILNGNFLGIICRDEIICFKKFWCFLKKKKKMLYFFNKESHGGQWISPETELILKYHDIEVHNYDWNALN